MKKKDLNITVIGAGHGGKAMAAEMASRGFRVTLYNRTASHIEIVGLRGGVQLTTEDGKTDFAALRAVTADIEEAVRDAHLVMVVIPASGHRDVALQAAPYLHDGQVIVLNPGRTGGALEFQHALTEANCPAAPIICESETFLFASRSTGPAEARIFRTKFSVPMAAFPANHTETALNLLHKVYPQFIPAKNVLHTSMNNMGAIFHPALTLLNAGWIEATQGDFEFYMDGVTPATARVLDALDRERVTVAMSIDVPAQTARQWLKRAYAAEGDSLHDAMHANPGYKGISAPNRLNHRYIFEDVPCSLIPMALIGRQYGVATPTIDAIVTIANIAHGTDYWPKGRSPQRLGIQGMTVSELHRYVEEGPQR